jgi:hypothetical protein
MANKNTMLDGTTEWVSQCFSSDVSDRCPVAQKFFAEESAKIKRELEEGDDLVAEQLKLLQDATARGEHRIVVEYERRKLGTLLGKYSTSRRNACYKRLYAAAENVAREWVIKHGRMTSSFVVEGYVVDNKNYSATTREVYVLGDDVFVLYAEHTVLNDSQSTALREVYVNSFSQINDEEFQSAICFVKQEATEALLQREKAPEGSDGAYAVDVFCNVVRTHSST